jgi:hypothetical protein
MSKMILDLYSDKCRLIEFVPYGLDTPIESKCYYCDEPEFVQFYFTMPDGSIDKSEEPDSFCARCFMARAGSFLLRCYSLVMMIDESPLWLKEFFIDLHGRAYGNISREHSDVKLIDKSKEFIECACKAVGGRDIEYDIKNESIRFSVDF